MHHRRFMRLVVCKFSFLHYELISFVSPYFYIMNQSYT
ncbi:hypothetical protein DCAR_0934499 [Daucus carota subsp. sativus]|uniref:Uncharacterized protein n=1 Tax=Daucus carota subsp. sativus TaxID=79200 RepID=A0AAF0XXS0_DAUCS|nr:hypothetical protein DCAR_0934499 [Daucus carota subsp. sativus]